MGAAITRAGRGARTPKLTQVLGPLRAIIAQVPHPPPPRGVGGLAAAMGHFYHLLREAKIAKTITRPKSAGRSKIRLFRCSYEKSGPFGPNWGDVGQHRGPYQGGAKRPKKPIFRNRAAPDDLNTQIDRE